MKKWFGFLLVASLLCLLLGAAKQATDATAVLDKAITALGGKEKLEKAKLVTWKAKGTIYFQGSSNTMTVTTTAQGLDRYKQEFHGEFDGNPIDGVMVLAGDKAWRSFGGNKMPIDSIANEKRVVYLSVIPVTLLPLKGEGYKLEAQPEEKIAEKPVTVLKVTPPDGKVFTLYFDKETNLLVRVVAKVTGFQGEELTEETNYSDYKEMAGIQKATKLSSKRNGEKFIDAEITEFTTSEKEADAKTFAEP